MSNINLCVLGAGVVGLTTAVELQKEFGNATITLVADKFYEGTTSYVSPGLFYPFKTFKGPTDSITKQWYTTSYDHWNNIHTNHTSLQVGIKSISGYVFSSNDPSFVKNAHLENLAPEYRQMNEDELHLIPGNWKYGTFMTTFVIENGIYLPWITHKFLNNHGRIVGQKVEDISELVGKYDVVVNCTGIGAKALCQDNNLVPSRCQMLKVHAPWVDKFYYGDNGAYIIPGFEGVSLGILKASSSCDEAIDTQEAINTRLNCEAMLPELRNAPTIAQRVGFRPQRTPVRVEQELMSFNKGSIKVVHNYGHGANGVTAAPGTAKHCMQLVREALK